MLRKFIIAALCSWLLGASAEAQTLAGPDLVEVDVSAYPWSSIVKLNNSVGGSCTGAVIARDEILTAAHCIFNRRTGRFLRPASLHVLLGYQRGQYAVHALVGRYSVGPGYDPARGLATIASDWAVLKLAKPLPSAIRPLQFVEHQPTTGSRLMVASYARGRRHVLTADKSCQLLREASSLSLFENDCRGAQGSSGAPVLIPEGEIAFIVGIQVAMENHKEAQRMIAVSAQSIRQATVAFTTPP